MKVNKVFTITVLYILIIGVFTFTYTNTPFYSSLLDATLDVGNVANKVFANSELLRSNNRIDKDIHLIGLYVKELESMSKEMYELRKKTKVYENDYFDSVEHEKIESLLNRYLICRNALWEMVDYYVDFKEHTNDPVLQKKEFLLAYYSGMQISYYSSTLVKTFINEPSGIEKINQEFPSSLVKRGTYDLIFEQITCEENLKAIALAELFYENETNLDLSLINQIFRLEQYKRIGLDIKKLHKESKKNIEYILKEKSIIFPNMTNAIRQSVIGESLEKTQKKLEDQIYDVRASVSKIIGDTKMPTVKAIKFSKTQVKSIKKSLKPGDIILTYSAGYMSNIFLPGIFKHGIVYIGTKEERAKLNIREELYERFTDVQKKKIDKALTMDKFENNTKVDIVEAVSEGVIFNSLDEILDSHVNRIAVLRPDLETEEINEGLLDVFKLIGQPYDFAFDFNDGSRQCCTEVIFRMLNGRGDFDLKLTKRAGTYNLSADDIINYYFKKPDKSFEVIIFGKNNKDIKGKIAILYNDKLAVESIEKLVTIK